MTGSVCIRIPNCDKQDWDTEHLRPKSIQSQPFGWDFYPGKFPDLLKATYRAIHSDCGLGHTMPNLTSSLLLLDRRSRRGCRTCHKQARLQGHLGSQHLAQNPWQNLTEAAKASTHSTHSDPPSNFRGDVVTLTLYVTKIIHKLGAIEWGCWAPFFPKMAFNNLDIGGIFPCYKMPLRFQQLHI